MRKVYSISIKEFISFTLFLFFSSLLFLSCGESNDDPTNSSDGGAIGEIKEIRLSTTVNNTVEVYRDELYSYSVKVENNGYIHILPQYYENGQWNNAYQEKGMEYISKEKVLCGIGKRVGVSDITQIQIKIDGGSTLSQNGLTGWRLGYPAYYKVSDGSIKHLRIFIADVRIQRDPDLSNFGKITSVTLQYQEY